MNKDYLKLKLANGLVTGKCILTQITKQAQEVIFSRKSKKTDHPTLHFSHAPIAYTNCHKHLGMYLDEKLNFLQHIKEKTSKANRGIGVIRKLRHSSKTLSYYYI